MNATRVIIRKWKEIVMFHMCTTNVKSPSYHDFTPATIKAQKLQRADCRVTSIIIQ